MDIKQDICFSVIMPTYNRAFCICDAIDSLLAQSFSNYELIIIDDGSSDNTEELIQSKYWEFLENGKIIYHKQKNKGVCYARNTGLKLAKNEWITYLDTDNSLTPYFLEVFKKEIEKNPEFTIFYSQTESSAGRIIGQELDYGILCRCNLIDLGCFVHKRSLCEKYGYFDLDLKRLVDWDLILRYTRYEKSFFINKVLLKYYDGKHPRITTTESFITAETCVKNKLANIFHPFYNKDTTDNYIQVFFDTGNGFSEYESASFSSFPIKLKWRDNLKALRVDPSTRFCFVQDISIQADGNRLSFETNAFGQKDNSFFFSTNDSQIFVNLPDTPFTVLECDMKVFDFDERISSIIKNQLITIDKQREQILVTEKRIEKQKEDFLFLRIPKPMKNFINKRLRKIK